MTYDKTMTYGCVFCTSFNLVFETHEICICILWIFRVNMGIMVLYNYVYVYVCMYVYYIYVYGLIYIYTYNSFLTHYWIFTCNCSTLFPCIFLYTVYCDPSNWLASFGRALVQCYIHVFVYIIICDFKDFWCVVDFLYF